MGRGRRRHGAGGGIEASIQPPSIKKAPITKPTPPRDSGKGKGRALMAIAPGKGHGKVKNSSKASTHHPYQEKVQSMLLSQYEKVNGTQICTREDGRVVRVALATGKDYHPNDIRGITSHLEKVAAGTYQGVLVERIGGGRGKGGGKNAASKGSKGGNAGRHEDLHGPLHQQYEKVKGTKIRTSIDGRVVRVAVATGKEYAPNDIRGITSHLEKVEAGTYQGALVERIGGAKGKGGGKKDRRGNLQGALVKSSGSAKGKGGGKVLFVEKIGGAKGKGGGRGVVKHGKASPEGGKGNSNNVKKLGKFAKKSRKRKERKERTELTPEEEEARDQKRAERAAQREAEEARQLCDNDTYYEGEVMTRAKSFAWVRPKTLKDVDDDVKAQLKEMNAGFRNKAKERVEEGSAARPSIFLEKKVGNLVYVRLSDVAEEGLSLEPGTMVKFKYYTDTKGVGGYDVVSA